MKKVIYLFFILIFNLCLSQENNYYSVNYRIRAGDAVDLKLCKVLNETYVYKEHHENDTIRIIGLETCNNGESILKYYLKGKIHYDKMFNGIIKNKNDEKYSETFRTAKNDLNKIKYFSDDNEIKKYLKIDSINNFKKEQILLNDKNKPCDYISLVKDKFTNTKQYSTESIQNITITKDILNNTNTYYISVFYNDSFLTTPVSEVSLILLFSDGTKIIKKDILSVDYSSYKKSYQYHFFSTLNSNDIKLLSTKTITDYKLFIFEKELNTSLSERLRHQLKCLINKN